MNRITHFDMPAKNPEKLSKFYSKIFGWKFNQWENNEYWMITTGKGERGINGGMMKEQSPSHIIVNTIEVKDIDETIKSIKENSGEITIQKRPIQGIGWMAYFKDPEGLNVFGLIQMDKTAK
jgi:uncharacterized protein